MSDHEKQYPDNWQIKDYNPNDHMMDLKGRDYLNVQNRLLWFIRDQRALIVRGLAQVPYIIRTELIELDREKGYALFMTYIRDVLGNETTAYGSETAKDFGDYAEKAGTKSEGRALLNMGYGTAAAPEMDEGERVVDTPVERKRPTSEASQRSSLDNYLKAPQPVQPAVAPVPVEMAEAARQAAAAATTTTLNDSDLTMTRQQFLLKTAEMGYSPKRAMDTLGVRSLDGLNLSAAFEQLKAVAR